MSDGSTCTVSYLDTTTYYYKTDAIITLNVVDRTQGAATGVSNIEASMFSLTPNPTNGIAKVNLSKALADKDIAVLNMVGSVIQTITNSPASATLDLSAQPKGVYIVRVNTENGFVSQRIIKQ